MVFPACAGVIRGSLDAGPFFCGVPRMCGGDPIIDILLGGEDKCSPHVRG